MDNTERERRNARRRRDLERPLDFMKLYPDTMDDLLEAKAKQAHDCIAMFKYLAMHPQMGNFIPGAADWGAEKAKRILQIRGEIAADCALFHRENGGIRCTAWSMEEAMEVIGKRKIRHGAALARWNKVAHASACASGHAEEEIEDIEPIEKELPPSYSPRTACTAPNTSRPNNREEVAELFAWRFNVGGVEDDDYLHNCIERFIEGKEEAGWIDTQGQPIKNWLHLARVYADECVNTYKIAEAANGKDKGARGSV